MPKNARLTFLFLLALLPFVQAAVPNPGHNANQIAFGINDTIYTWPDTIGQNGQVLTIDSHDNKTLKWNPPSGGSGAWASSGINIYNTNTGYVGIGTSSPEYSLDVLSVGSTQGVRFTAATVPKIYIYSTGTDDASFRNYGLIANQYPGVFEIRSGASRGAEPTVGRLAIDNQGHVGIGTTSPDPSALLDLSSPSSGLLIPRMSDSARNQIVNPAEGLIIYNSQNHQFEYCKSPPCNTQPSGPFNWAIIGGGSGSSQWSTTSNGIYYTGGNVAIGDNNPLEKLYINGGGIRLGDLADLSIITEPHTAPYNIFKIKYHPHTGGPTQAFLNIDSTVNLRLSNLINCSGRVTTDSSGALQCNTANIVSGSGSPSYLAKWNSTGLTDSKIYDNGTNIGIDTSSPSTKLHVSSSSSDDVYVSADAPVNKNAGYSLRSAGTEKSKLYLTGSSPFDTRINVNGKGDVFNISGSTGFIGIGATNTSPVTSLDIYQSTTYDLSGFPGLKRLVFGPIHTSYDYMGFCSRGSTGDAGQTIGCIGTQNGWWFWGTKDGSTYSNRLSLSSNGDLTVTNNLTVNNAIQIKGGNPAANSILTSDASGNATWAPNNWSATQANHEVDLAGFNISNVDTIHANMIYATSMNPTSLHVTNIDGGSATSNVNIKPGETSGTVYIGQNGLVPLFVSGNISTTNGNITTTNGIVNGKQVCINGTCKTSWPAGLTTQCEQVVLDNGDYGIETQLNCASDRYLSGGGAECNPIMPYSLKASKPNYNGWYAKCMSTSGNDYPPRKIIAVCCKNV